MLVYTNVCMRVHTWCVHSHGGVYESVHTVVCEC